MTQLGWIKRRARRLQRAFRISRRLALVSAHDDYLCFRGKRA
jgi:hypothetical protein